MRELFTTQVQVGPTGNWHRIRYVASLVPIARREVSRRLLITGESLRRIRIPHRRLVYVSRQEFGIAPHYRCRCHDIFRRHGRFTDIHSNRFRFHGGTVFRSFPNPIVIGSMRIRPLQDLPTQISFL